MSICIYRMNGGVFDDMLESGVLKKYDCAFNNLLTVVTHKIPDYIIFNAHNAKDINLEIRITTDNIHLISVYCTNTRTRLGRNIVFNADFIHSDNELMQSFRDWFKIFDNECKSHVYWDNQKIELGFQSFLKSHPRIKKVIFHDPATIVYWNDGSKTIVKASNEDFDPEKGLAMAITKKFFGNNGNYYNEIRKWLIQEEVENGRDNMD